MEKALGKVMFKFEHNPPPEVLVHTKFVYPCCIYKILMGFAKPAMLPGTRS